ncbi:MAG: type I glyceraldehyde-3-phosphate dehydrogenase [Cystobacterineae bacterium]|nr:type I glyceraldehyde-3-phosphate dehydrogenase [Cystobacterineae bacterium]
MAVKVAINGFGRIGRCVLRAALSRQATAFEVVAINDLDKPAALAHLFKYDSVHGVWPGEVKATDKGIVVDGREICVTAEKEPANLPWKALGVELVFECTGRFVDKDSCAAHLKAGAKKVLISAPGKGVDVTLAYGVNHQVYDAKAHHIISNASCTTNCLAPIAKVLHGLVGIERGLMTTIHSYTNDQRILDLVHKDLRRARAAALSMIPTSTGAAKAIAEVIPELKGKLHGISVRVPTPNVSLVDLTVLVKRPTTVEEVNAAFQKAAEGELRGVLEYCELPTVSTDYNGNPHSAIFDAMDTCIMEGNMVKVLAWYDNEWGYSTRIVDVAQFIISKGL